MRCCERSLLAYVVPGAVYDLFVFAKTSLEGCVLHESISQSFSGRYHVQYPHEITLQRRPWSSVYPSPSRGPWL